MAASTTVYASTPLSGINLGASPVSTPAHHWPLKVFGSDGRAWVYGKASEAIGSITTCKVGSLGSVSDDSGSAGWTANVPGGAAAGQYFWLKRTSIA